jgi:hypothetical protein
MKQIQCHVGYASAGCTAAAMTTQRHEANTNIFGRYEHFGEFPGVSIVTVYPRTLVDPTRKFESTSPDTTVSGILFLSAGNISQTS